MAGTGIRDGLPGKVLGIAATAIGAAMLGAHTDLIRDLPRISPKVVELDAAVKRLQERADACSIWQVDHQRFSEEASRELHAGIDRNSSEIERLRERIDRAYERR